LKQKERGKRREWGISKALHAEGTFSIGGPGVKRKMSSTWGLRKKNARGKKF